MRQRKLRSITVLLAALGLLAGCGVADPAASPAAVGNTAASASTPTAALTTGVTVPLAPPDTTAPGPTPTPWQSLLPTDEADDTTVEQTTPRTFTSLTFTTFADVTTATAADPTKIAAAPPACYSSGECAVLSRDQVAGGAVEVVNPAGGASSTVILNGGTDDATALAMARLSSPELTCSGSLCVLQGKKSGLYFGSALRVKDGKLTEISGTAQSATKLRWVGSVLAGSIDFLDYGLGPADSPRAAITWEIASGSLSATGCGTPRLYRNPGVPDVALTGPCSGTPQVAGFGAGSATKFVSISGFVSGNGNIQCGLTTGGNLVCTAKKHSVKTATCKKPVKDVPKNMRGLRVIVLAAGGVTVDDCLGYSLLGASKAKTAAGQLAVGRGFVCEVQSDSVDCLSPSGRGFVFNAKSVQKR